MKPYIISMLLVLSLALPASAELKLAGVFGDNMVLQQEPRTPIWGWADAGQKVSVVIAGQTADATADANGRWQILIGPLTAGGPFELTITADSDKKTLVNVMVGEVWLCSGQSNMYLGVNRFSHHWKDIAEANYPKLRVFMVNPLASDEPQQDANGQWLPVTPKTVGDFSAVGYYFGRDLQRASNVPVGIVVSAWNGAYIESFTSKESLSSDADYALMVDRWTKALAHAPQLWANYQQALAEYEKAAIEANAAGKPGPRKPGAPYPAATVEGSPHIVDQSIEHYPIPHPSALYNGEIAPLVGLGIRGIVWYQGESNFFWAVKYRRLLPLLFRDWRTKWERPDLPLLYVQIPNIGKLHQPPQPADDVWAELREAQAMAQSEPNVAMVVTIDTGNGDIHPNDKQTVARRLVLAAQGAVYGKDVAFKSPTLSATKIEGGKVRLTFANTAGGLKTAVPPYVLTTAPAKPTTATTLSTSSGQATSTGSGQAASTPSDSNEVRGFAVAGADRQFVWAQAQIAGNDVLVWSDRGSQPVAVRYAWAGFPDCNLYNAADLPAAPFRTDDWPLLSTDRK